jgi:quinol monooxygenase YgiN
MISVGLVVKLTAKEGKADELGSFLAGALPLAVDEAGTPIWLALKTDASTFWIVDAFPTDAERQDHLTGPIAAALMAKADELLAAAPDIGFAEVLAAKPA